MCPPKPVKAPVNPAPTPLDQTEQSVVQTTETATTKQQNVLGKGVPSKVIAPVTSGVNNIRM